MRGYQALPEERCGNCTYFCQHYRRERRKEKDCYFPLWLGHCAHPRLKFRRAEEHCQYFTPGPKDPPDESGEG